MIERQRVLSALRKAGARGVTQVDFLAPDVIDGGTPITRLPARVLDLRNAGLVIVGAGRRDKCKIYVLETVPNFPEIQTALCRSCDRPVVWVTVNGRPHPCDSAPVPTPALGLVARHPERGTGKVLSTGDLGLVDGWLGSGVTLHRSHFASCPDADAYRTRDLRPGQTQLLGDAA